VKIAARTKTTGKAAILLLAAFFGLIFMSCRPASSSGKSGTVIINGDLTHGLKSPDGWRTDFQDSTAASFDWRQVGGLGEISISNLKPQDSRWIQDIHLIPGWYLFSASMRTAGIPKQSVGASLSILIGGIISPTSSGDTGWHRESFYLEVDQPADVQLACRLGGYGSPNTGKAFFRDIQVSRVDEPPADAGQKFDLDVERGVKNAGFSVASSRINPLVIGAILLALVAFLATWIYWERDAIGSGSLWNSVLAGMREFSSDREVPIARTTWTPSWLEIGLVALGALLFTIAFTYPILLRLSYIGIVWDWSEKLSHAWAAVTSIKTFHQIPLWDPYSCGGMPLLANPLFPGLTPWFSLELLFGPVVGVNLQIPIHLAIAWAGGYVLARCLGMGAVGGLTCASVFAASSWFSIQVVTGHFEMMATAYLPWIIACFWESVERRQLGFCLIAALLVAIAFGEGGIYICARVALLIPLLALYLAVSRRDVWPIEIVGVFALAAFGFCAIKLLPSAQLIRLHPRFIYEPEYNPVSTLLYAIFTRNQYWDHPSPPPGGFYEFGAYFGPIAAVLAIIGIAGSWRRSIPWLLCAAMLFSFAIGSPRPWFPWALLRHLPVYSSMRIPSISLQTGFILMMAMVSALGADFLATSWNRYGVVLALALACCAGFDAWTVTMPNVKVTVMNRANQSSNDPEFRQIFASPFNMFGATLANRGSVYCNESLNFSNLPENVIGLNQPGYLGEQYLVGPGSVNLLRWTPNALTFDVDAEGNKPAGRILVINQNYDPAWRVGEGSGEVFSEGNLLGVRVPEGRQRLELVYRNYVFYVGAIVTFLTGIISLLVWRYERGVRTVQ
jgi:hypothetical protein